MVSYDRKRDKCGEILRAWFTEEEVLAGKFQSAKAQPKMLISKPLAVKRNSP